MSSQINATYVDPRISEIRSSVNQKTDAIPFLLMPVRIETRFMQVQSSSSQVQPTGGSASAAMAAPDSMSSSTEDVMEAIGNLNILTVNTQTKLSGLTLRAVTAEANRIAESIKDLGKISIKEKGWLKQVYKSLEEDVQKVTAAAGGAYVEDAKKLAAAVETLKRTILSSPHEKVNTLPHVTGMIESLTVIDTELKTLTSRREKIPFLNVKNKKDLYIYVTKVLDKAHQFYTDVDTKTAGWSSIAKNQGSRLGELHNSVQSSLAKMKNSLTVLHADRNWKKFIDETVSKKLTDLQTNGQSFTGKTLPRISSRPQPDDLQTGDIVLHGVQTLVKIKRFNAKYNNAGQEEVAERFKAEVLPRIDKLSHFITRPIQGATDSRIASIKRVFGNISTEVNGIGGGKTPITDTPPILGRPGTGKLPNKNTPPILDQPADAASSFRASASAFSSGESTPLISQNSLTALKSFAGNETTAETQPNYVTATVPMINQLWVRIYPDDVFIKTHEEYLTVPEYDTGKLFWKTWWVASNDSDLELAAWRTLCTALGTKRASWVARSLDPRGIAANNPSLQSKPSQNMTDSINIVTAIVGELKKINTNPAPADIFLSLHPGTVLQQQNASLQQALLELNTLSNVQSFLWDKHRGLLTQTASIINTLIEKSQALSAAQQTQFSTTLAALQALINSFTSVQTRAAQIAVKDDKDFVSSQTDPLQYLSPQVKFKDWDKAPTSMCLPDRFVVVTVKDGSFRHIAVCNQISGDLQMGLDPAKFSNGSLYGIDANGNLILESGLKWMVDFDEAVTKGMGIKLTLDDFLYNNGFDKLIVVGVKNTDSTNSKTQLEKLLLNHIYSADGMSFLKTGTPTNNTQDKKADFGIDDDVEERFNIEIKGLRYDAAQTNPLTKSDGKYFSDALGITNGVAQYANSAGNFEIANALAMNRSLWPATMGHYMEEMWNSLFPYDNIRRTEKFFTSYVTGRGIVPSLRIGMQPYGILTTTAFSQLQLHNTFPALSRLDTSGVTPWDAPSNLEPTLQTRFELRMHQFLMMLYGVWSDLSAQVIHSGNLHNGGDPQQRFISMLGLHATSLDYFYRYSLNVAKGPSMTGATASANFAATDPAGPTALYERYKNLMKQGVFFPSFDFEDEDPARSNGQPAWKITDRAYSRIKDQIESAKLFDARHINDSYSVTGSLVDTVPPSEGLLSSISGQSINYIDWLLSKSANDLFAENEINNPARIPSNSMLFLLLRQGLLQSYQEAAMNLLQKETIIKEFVRKDLGTEGRYFYRLLESATYKNYYLTKWHFLLKNTADLFSTGTIDITGTAEPFYRFIVQNTSSVGNYLDRVRDASPAMFSATHQQYFDKLKKARESLGTLKRASTESLEVLMAEHIDITSYRLDAWLLGLAHQRLLKQRSTQANGIFLGAYGYVENLKRDPGRDAARIPADDWSLTPYKLPAGKPAYEDVMNGGFIHAPSQSQAIAAAVLRNAYQTNNESGDVANRLSVNLSSARVRMALQLIDGIRNGQEVGALLGFQFERGLHERYKTVELDKFIQPFRKAFPLQQNVATTANGAPGYVSLVMNGQAVLDLVYEKIEWLGSNVGQPGIKTVADILKYNGFINLPQKIKATIDGALATTDDKNKIYNAIIEEIDRMADAFDAMGDLAVSESVYQIVQGNHVRAASVLTALAEGKSIPDPQIIETPRNGTLVTQRVLFNFSTVTSASAPPGWSWDAKSSYRFNTEPSFNNWLGRAIGEQTKWKYLLKTYNPQTNQLLLSVQGTLAIQGWQPIDFFELPGGEAELRDILIAEFRRGNDDYNSIITLDLNERHPSWPADEKTIPELFLIFKQIRNMLGNARVAGLSDLKIAGASIDSQNPGNFNMVDLEARAYGPYNGAYTSLDMHIRQIESQVFIQQVINGVKSINDFVATATDMWFMHLMLNRSGLFGIPNALTCNLMQGDTPEKRGRILLQHLLNILKQLKARYQVANDIAVKLPAYTVPKVRAEKLMELAKAVFGRSFLIVPSYGISGTEPVTIQLAIPAAQGITRQGGIVAVEDWLQNISRIRKRLYDAQMYIQVADVYDLPVPTLRPVQLPYTSGDHWLGIEYPSNYTPSGDKLSLVLLNESVFTQQGVTSYSSLIVDEWVEIIPNKEITSGIAFNYNQPNAAAPQSMLLAVTPNVTNRWEWDDLVYTVIDTMALAKIRAVEPDHLEGSVLNHVLPAVISEIAPPQFKNKAQNPLGVQVVMDFAEVKPKATT